MDFIPNEDNENNSQLHQSILDINDNRYKQINLNDQINNLKIENNNLKNENISLKNEIKTLNNQIQILNKQIKSYTLELNNKNNTKKNLNYEIVKLNSKKEQFIKKEYTISIQFISIFQKVDISIPCLLTDKFVRIEEIIYDKYPEYKDNNTYFTVRGGYVKRFKTIQENNIRNLDKILLNVYE